MNDLRILLAEDNAVNQKVGLSMLRRLGYNADLAGNGFEAILAMRAQPYDVILMDVQMPELDGLAASRLIRAEFPRLLQPIIIAMTATDTTEDKRRCLAAGMDDYLPKPVRMDLLMTALAKCVPIPSPLSGAA
jgi:CheY-like chemotaxis protein